MRASRGATSCSRANQKLIAVVRVDHFAAAAGAQRLISCQVDVLRHELHGAVAHADDHTHRIALRAAMFVQP